MAIKLISQEWCPYSNDHRSQYILDSAEDAENLPEACPGSIAMVADKDGAIYMVNASGEWKEQ